MEKTVYFFSSDGIKLAATLTLPPGDTKSCVILCHGIGYGRNIEDIFPDLALLLSNKGLAVFRFDFRGHGDSAGKQREFTISGQLKDIEAAVSWIKTAGYLNLGITAISFGAGAAALYAARIPGAIKSLAFLFPVIDYGSLLEQKTGWAKQYFGPDAIINIETRGFAKIGSRGFEIGRELIAEMNDFKPWREISKIKIPVLFVHGDADDAVPLQDSIKYSRNMNNSKLEVIAGGEHGLSNSKEIINKTIGLTADFMVKNLL